MKAISRILLLFIFTLYFQTIGAQVNFGAGGTFSVSDVRPKINSVTTRFNTYELQGQQLKPMSAFGAMAGLDFAFRYRFPRIFGVEFGYSIMNSEAKDLYQDSPTQKSYKNIISYRQSVLHAGIEMRAGLMSIGASYGAGVQTMTWKKTNDSKFGNTLLKEALDVMTVHFGYDWQPHEKFSVAFRPFFQFSLGDSTDFSSAEAKFVQQGTVLQPNLAKVYNYGIKIILFNGPTDSE